jgi:TPR repeat protein
VARAVELLKQAGETGSPRAQSELVKLYETGSDVPVNGKEAIYWQEKLAQNSPLDPQPRIHLAEMYLDPKLGGPNLDAATDACKQFINTTIRNTCLALVEERRPNPDYRKAAAWFKAGAEALNFTAVEHYAHLLAAGKGVKQDDVKAYYWLRVLQELGYRAHAEDLMDDVSKKLTPAERAKQDKEVAKLRIVPGQH